MTALAGVLLTGYSRTNYLTIGDSFQLHSIAAVVVGGSAILGGLHPPPALVARPGRKLC